MKQRTKKWGIVSIIMTLVITASLAMIGCDDDSSDQFSSIPTLSYDEVVQGNIGSDLTLTTGTTYLIRGTVNVMPGVTLTVEPGVTVLGDTSVLSYLIVLQGAKIEAVGTALEPITFTSNRAPGYRDREDWGGIVINGRAYIGTNDDTTLPADDANGTAYGEGNSGIYGGEDDSDNSGTLQYVRIMFAGKKFNAEDELNGLALQGVGDSTTIDHIQLHNCSDDGIEMFGGKVDLSYIISSGNNDDQIDWTSGWRGRLQFAISCPIDGDRGIEADNDSGTTNQQPQSTVYIANYTYIRNDGEDVMGAQIRRGTRAYFYNAYFAGAADDQAIYAENTNTIANADYLLIEASGTSGYSDDGTASLTITNDTINATASYLDMSNFTSLEALEAAGAAAFAPATPNTTANDLTGVSIDLDHGDNGTWTSDTADFATTGAGAQFIGAVGSTNWVSGWTEFPAD